jgi:hypothetical protein
MPCEAPSARSLSSANDRRRIPRASGLQVQNTVTSQAGKGHRQVQDNPEMSSALKLLGRPNGRSTMTANRLELVGLSVLVLTLTTTVSLAQNTSNPLLSGNTVNPVMSGNTVAAGHEAPVSPAPGVSSLSTGTNPFTGLPCSGPPQQEAPRRQLERHFRAFLDLRLAHVEVIGPHLPV